ncbi:MAG TPA: AraC family transcriptional regulator [Planctomycetota bacterium]|nr:AraC family transcriptional regulator [Planctomycetota bacterium]
MADNDGGGPCTPELLVVVHNLRDIPAPNRAWRHECHFLTILLKGEGCYRNGELELPAHRPIISLLPRGDEDYDAISGKVESWYAGFHWPGMTFRWAGKTELDISWNGRSQRVPRVKCLDAAAVLPLIDGYRAMREALARQDLSGKILANALLMQQFTRFTDQPGGPDTPPSHRALAKFHDKLQRHACEDISIEQLAEESGATADHLRELFRERFGMRPVEYRTGLRLAKARELLSSTNMNVKEVAHKAGFADPLYFSRVFRQQFGISPREMIRRFRL